MCNAQMSYEPELFPALLISNAVSSTHVTLFPNGKGVITGVRRYGDALVVIKQCLGYLKKHIRKSTTFDC